MPEYRITRKEIWHSYLYFEADSVDDAIAMAEDGEGEIEDSEYMDWLSNISIRNMDTQEVNSLEVLPVDPADPNSVFSKSKKQEELDTAIKILDNKHLTFPIIKEALEILRSIKNI